jgi:hypothetical protein
MGSIFERYPKGPRTQIASSRHRLTLAQEAAIDLQLLTMVAVLCCAAYRCDGFVGIALVGLTVLFVALQLDIDRGVLSRRWVEQQIALRDPRRSASSADNVSEVEASSRPFALAKLLGVALAIIGVGGLVI